MITIKKIIKLYYNNKKTNNFKSASKVYIISPSVQGENASPTPILDSRF